MERISDKDAKLILEYLKRARMVVSQYEKKSNDGEVYMDFETGSLCIDEIDGIVTAIDNAIE